MNDEKSGLPGVKAVWKKYRHLWNRVEEPAKKVLLREGMISKKANYLMDWAVERQAAFIRHFFSFLKDTPRERYKNLLQDRPQIIQRVPLQYIASYLGITPVSLSRIRNKV